MCFDPICNKWMSKPLQRKLSRLPRIVPLFSGPLVSFRSPFYPWLGPILSLHLSTDGQLQFDQGGNAAILALLNAMNNTVDAMNNTVNVMNNTINGLDRRLSRIEIVMENARIVKRNQHLRSLGPGQVYGLRRKEVSTFTVLRWPCFVDTVCRSLALERLLRNRSMEVFLYRLTLTSIPHPM
jgi:hypothetical protein